MASNLQAYSKLGFAHKLDASFQTLFKSYLPVNVNFKTL